VTSSSAILATLRAIGSRRARRAEETAIRNGALAEVPPETATAAVRRIESELLAMIEGNILASGGVASDLEKYQVTDAGIRTGGTLLLGDHAPDFEAETTHGRIRFHDWLGDSWAVLFSHPGDFTPVSTTELGYAAKIQSEFESRNVKLIALALDSVDNHLKWAADIEETQGAAPNYPVIGDADFNVSRLYGMLPVDLDETAERIARGVRNVFVIGPDKKIKLILVYPMTTGRNFDEILRVIDSLQLTAKHKVATPVNWRPGDDVIIAGSVSDEQAKEIYPEGWEAPKPYIRIVPRPAD
jgi:alkyl hydroperoxide reductase subunit AhpC